MSVKMFIICLFLTGIAVSGLGLYVSGHGVIDIHNAKIIFDWDGVYKGVLPAAEGPGIDVCLKLNKDESYELMYKYLNNPEKLFIWAGSFNWNKLGNIITLNIANTPVYYKVAENKVIQLDKKRKPITGKFAVNYVLRKEVNKPDTVTAR